MYNNFLAGKVVLKVCASSDFLSVQHILYILSALERARSEQPAAPRAFLGRHVPRREKPDTARGFAAPTCRGRSASVRPRPAGERGEREGEKAMIKLHKIPWF